MYLEHFGFREEPFGATPQPKFLYFSPDHAEALASLHYGLLERRGVAAVVAGPGMGKTTLLRHLAEIWKDRAEIAFVFPPPETREQLLASVLDALGLDPAADSRTAYRLLGQRGVECRRKGKRLLLLFDEAQAIPPAVLEEIRLLTTLETPEEKLLEIILAGQPVLLGRLGGAVEDPLRQRVALAARIGRLDAAEVRRYVEHRLRLAGCKSGGLFTNRALAALAQLSGGVPRIINAICFEALSSAWAAARRRIDDREIRSAAAALDPARAARIRKRRFGWKLRWAAALALLAAGAAAGRFYWLHRGPVRTEAAPPMARSAGIQP